MHPGRLGRRTLIAAALLGALLAGCAGAPRARSTATPRPSAVPTPALGLLGLAGEASQPLQVGRPYLARANLELAPAHLYAVTVPATPAAAVTALATALGVPGPPTETGAGWAYNLGATSGYQLTTDPGLDAFNFHPNRPVDETGATPTLAAAQQFAAAFIAADHLPAGGGLEPQPQLSSYHAADRTAYFQWTLHGLPVVSIQGLPEQVAVDVAASGSGVLSVVGISGSIPYGATGTFAAYPAMPVYQAVEALNRGQIDPAAYILDPEGKTYSPGAGSGPTAIVGVSVAVVDSFGTAVPVYGFGRSSPAGPAQFVTCAPPVRDCVPLRLGSGASPSPGG